MNLFALLFILVCVGVIAVGALGLLMAIFKTNWKWAICVIGGTIGLLAILGLLTFGALRLLDPRLRRPVAQSEVVGVWTLSPKSVTLATKDLFDAYHPKDGAKHELELRQNGTCHFRSILQMPTEYTDCEGEWKLGVDTSDAKVPMLYLTLHREKRDHGISLYFADEQGRLTIWGCWGDPDNGERLEYHKRPNPIDPPNKPTGR